jgi:hypothetical protein
MIHLCSVNRMTWRARFSTATPSTISGSNFQRRMALNTASSKTRGEAPRFDDLRILDRTVGIYGEFHCDAAFDTLRAGRAAGTAAGF